MKGVCRLFDIETDLVGSHIIPRFAFDHMKRTGSKFLRRPSEPNIRLQDGTKKHWLSNEAEAEFSKRETWFANKIFYPYLSGGKKRIQYDDNLLHFTISVLWRVLLEQIEHPSLIDEPYLDRLKVVAEDWKLFLRGDKKLPDYRRVYIYLTDSVVYHDVDSNEVNYYFTRTVDATIVANDPPTFVSVYAKFNRFMFWSTIIGGSTKGLGSIKINPSGGSLNLPQTCNDIYMNHFFVNRIMQLKQLPEVSEKQKKIIKDHFNKYKEEFLKSDAADAMRNDISLENRIIIIDN